MGEGRDQGARAAGIGRVLFVVVVVPATGIGLDVYGGENSLSPNRRLLRRVISTAAARELGGRGLGF